MPVSQSGVEQRQWMLAEKGESLTPETEQSHHGMAIEERGQKPSTGVPLRYLLVLWVLVLSTIAFLDRTNISIAGVWIAREFRIDNAHLGWVFSAFLVGYASFQIPGGVLVRRFGPRRVLGICVVFWGIFTVLTAVTPPHLKSSLLLLIAVRILLGASSAVMYPSANQFVERWFPIPERGRGTGIVFGGVGLGSGVAPPLLTAIILNYSWHAAFWFCALVGLIAGAVWYVVARDAPEEHPWIRRDELVMITAGRGDLLRAEIAASRERAGSPWGQIFSSRQVLALSGSYFTYGYISWIFFSWFYIYLAQVRGLSLKTSAVYSIFPFIAMSAGSLTGGITSDWLAHHWSARAGRCYLPAFALALTGTLLAVGSTVENAIAATAVLACGAGSLYLSQSCFWSVSADYAGKHTGVVSATVNMACQIGGAVTASVTPLIAAHFGWQASFFTATALAMLGAAAWLFVDPEARLAR